MEKWPVFNHSFNWDEPIRSFSSFDATKLCGKWRLDWRLPQRIYPTNCDRSCEGCSLLLQVIRLFGMNDVQNPAIEVRTRRVLNASFLAIRGGYFGRESCGVFYSVEGASNPWNLRGRLPTGSPAVMRQARHWLAHCLEQHMNCRPAVELEPQLPTRILDLGHHVSDAIVLRETSGETGLYICLSYCWGRADFLKTTRENLESHKQVISMSDLPQTFQDTVQVARALDVRYLWIDSLCIIQEDEDGADWKRESCRMADVYRNSYLTVAAIGAGSAHDGLFAPQEDLDFGCTSMRQIHHFPFKANLVGSPHFPLLYRAWAYQERILAPRVLYFGRQELVWECLEGRRCECAWTAYSTHEVHKGACHTVMGSDIPIATTPQRLWRQMVVQYSPLQLTYPSDKLPALAGLAAWMKGKHKREYLAGLWGDTLVHDMCWYRTIPEGHQLPPPPEPQRAPTWSWSSVDGPIEYHPMLYAWIEMPPIEEYVKIIDVHHSLEGLSRTGQVEDITIELSCFLIPVKVCLDDPPNPLKALSGNGNLVHPELSDMQWHSDGRCETQEFNDHYLVPMMSAQGIFYGLVVAAVNQELQTMVRIGLVEMTGWPTLIFPLDKRIKII